MFKTKVFSVLVMLTIACYVACDSGSKATVKVNTPGGCVDYDVNLLRLNFTADNLRSKYADITTTSYFNFVCNVQFEKIVGVTITGFNSNVYNNYDRSNFFKPIDIFQKTLGQIFIPDVTVDGLTSVDPSDISADGEVSISIYYTD